MKSSNETLMLDFSNSKIAFSHLSDSELKKVSWLFYTMNKQWLVDIGAKVGMKAIKLNLPFVESIIKSTIFDQFCGGTTLLNSEPTIELLANHNVHTVLDYGAEGKDEEQAFNKTMNENRRAIDFSSTNDNISIISTKISGLASNSLLKKVQIRKGITWDDLKAYRVLLKRIDSICHRAAEKGISVFIDAEETWIQDTIDHLVNIMMARYNKTKVVVYNTFQMYRKDSLQKIVDSYSLAQEKGYLLGAKLVRGAYMEKERERAQEQNYPSPIHDTKSATDDAYNIGIRFCIDNLDVISCSASTHNAESNLLLAKLIDEKGINKLDSRIHFCQLFGMSDAITFNLANAGYRVGKYVPYGAVAEVIPYLIRRAEENSSIKGDMSREYAMVMKEIKRRKLD